MNKITVGSNEYKQALARWARLNTKSRTTPLDDREQQEFDLIDEQLERAEMKHSMALAGAHT